MSEIPAAYVDDVLATARRVIADPDRNAVHVPRDEIVALCTTVIVQHAMIRAGGIAYPRAPQGARPAPPLPPPLFGPQWAPSESR